MIALIRNSKDRQIGEIQMIDIQALVNAMNAKWKLERSATQLTLGKLIDALENMPPEAKVANLRNPDSYRGYYSDLYFELHHGTRPASELLSDCKDAMGEVFNGYKGGDYRMGETTPLWVASYGFCGQKLMAVHAGGELETAEDD